MMIDFEDKMPAPPLSLGEKIFGVFIGVMQIAGLLSMLYGFAGIVGLR